MSKGNTQQTVASQQNNHSYDLVLELMRERATAQFDHVNALDVKANGIMTTATTLLGAALVLQAAWLSFSNRTIASLVLLHAQWPIMVLIIIYAITMIAATIAGYWIRTFERVPEPNVLQEYALEPMATTQSKMVGTMATAFDENKKAITFKVRWLKISTIFLLAEIITLAVSLFIQIYN